MAEKNHFVFKVIPPRPSFFADQTEREAAIMAEHVSYWTGLLNQGQAVAFGPVLDPAGAWGLAVVEAGAEADVHQLTGLRPSPTSGAGDWLM